MNIYSAKISGHASLKGIKQNVSIGDAMATYNQGYSTLDY
jgi:hypothetical protein